MTSAGGSLITKEWWSAQELADQRLPGLPTSKMGVLNRAKAEGWDAAHCDTRGPLCRRRQGRGAGVEYHFAVLPEKARTALLLRQPKPAAPKPAAETPRDRESAWARWDRLPASLKDVGKRRMAVIGQVETLIRTGMASSKAVEMVVERAAVEARLQGREPPFGVSTLYGWIGRVRGVRRDDWVVHLTPDYVGRTATAEVDPEVYRVFKNDYLRPRRSFAAAYRVAQDVAEARGVTLPACKTLQRRLEREVSRAAILLHKEGTEAFARVYPWIERDETAFHAMEAVNVDGHKWDVMVDFGDGAKPERPMMIMIQDVYSRRVLGWRIARSENADAVRMCFADVFRNHGIPRHCFFDNGKAFASKWLTGQTRHRFRFAVREEDQVGLLVQFGVEVHFTTPYSGQSKPIERAFGDLEGEIGTSAAFEGAYVGNDPLNKPASYREGYGIPLAEFEAVVANGIRRHNARPGRRTKTAGGKLSFDQVFAESLKTALVPRPTAEQLRQALLCVEGVTVRRNGHGLQLAGNRYWSEFLIQHEGQKVAARFDADDLHAGLHVYDLQTGAYLGHAECLEPIGFANAEEGREFKRLYKRQQKAAKELARAERDMSAAQLARITPQLADPDFEDGSNVVSPVFGNLALRPQPQPEGMTEAEVIDLHARALRGITAAE
ncbi:MAG: transposase domain-containing protein [Phenylobacterium sp.]|uniref:transposase domain-containing protein n=1 Tax=Phenylobacterium sp. TaxID=1871053 RepID=UPI00391969E6